MKPYIPTPETIEAFTEGDCWLLAYTLFRMTGKPMVFANPCPDDSTYWEHVGLQISANKILDIEGVHTNKAWRQKWAKCSCYDCDGNCGLLYRATDVKVIKHLLFDQSPMFDTRPHRPARRLLETYAPNLLNN